jgi:hypothetical protein
MVNITLGKRIENIEDALSDADVKKLALLGFLLSITARVRTQYEYDEKLKAKENMMKWVKGMKISNKVADLIDLYLSDYVESREKQQRKTEQELAKKEQRKAK